MAGQSGSKHRARKRFGQNFLHDEMVIQKIVQAIHPIEGQCLVEIGPGQGALTDHFASLPVTLDLVELDRDLVAQLQQRYASTGNIAIHSSDALKFDFSALARSRGKPLRVVGNLPYNISTPLLFHLLEQLSAIEDMHFMLQREVVQRMAATVGEKNYGRLSIMTQYFCRVEQLFDVPPQAFSPAPKVMSAIVRLCPHKELPVVASNTATLMQVVKTAFAQRRKTLRNSLSGVIDTAGLQALGIDPAWRAEVLTIDQFVAISNSINTGFPA